MEMSVERRWNGGMVLAGGEREYWERNMSQYHFVHHKSHHDLLLNEMTCVGRT